MTEKELLRFGKIKREILLLTDDIANIECDMKEMSVSGETVQASSPEYPFIFHSIGVSGLSDSAKSRELRLQLADKKAKLKAEREAYVTEYENIERFVSSVQDLLIRRIISYHYIEGMGYIAIAARLQGGWTADAVRMRMKRFLSKGKAVPENNC